MTRRPLGLFVGSSQALQEAVKKALRRGLSVSSFVTAKEALLTFSALSPDFVVSDYLLPDTDALDLYNRLALEGQVPILILMPSDGSWVEAPFKLDEMVKVISVANPGREIEEFLASLKLKKRRKMVDREGLEVDVALRTLSFRGKRVRISPKQAAVLAALVKKVGEVVSRQELVYALDPLGRRLSRSVDHHVARLRRCLDEVCGGEWAIETVYGAGYRLVQGRPVEVADGD